MSVVEHRMNTATDVISIEIHDVAYLTIHHAQVSEKLFFEELAIFHYRLQFQDQLVVDTKIQSHIRRNEHTFVIDRYSHLVSDAETIVQQFVHHCLFINAFQESRSQVVVDLIDTSQHLMCEVPINHTIIKKIFQPTLSNLLNL